MKTKLILLKVLVIFSLVFSYTAVPVAAHHCFGHTGSGSTEISQCLDAGACLDTTGANCPDKSLSEGKVNDIIATGINYLSVIIGVVAVIMIIIGGLKYITSGGDSNNISSAKNTILYAIVGLVIVAFAQIIVRFVLSKV